MLAVSDVVVFRRRRGPPRRRGALASTIHAASHVDHEKELHGFLFLCMHVFLKLWRPLGGPPELCY